MQADILPYQRAKIKYRKNPSILPVSKEHETGFEPATLALARRYSTTEPLVHIQFKASSADELNNIKLKRSCQASGDISE